MRYLFRGLIRDTGRPVEGHVEAVTEVDACDALSENGVVTESLVPDPHPLNLNDELPKAPQFADALESAFDSSSSQVDFDALTERYHGKKVWVIDRDKIRRRVAQVVDAALALASLHGEGAAQTRQRVSSALEGMFADNRNLATERNADSIAGVKFNGESSGAPLPQMAPQMAMPAGARIAPYTNGNGNGNGHANGNGLSLNGHAGLEGQIGRLAALVKQAEATLAQVSAAARRSGGGGGGGGGGGPRRASLAKGGKSEEQNSVLLEIFKSNLNLVRGMQEPAGAVAAAPVAAEASATSEMEIETGLDQSAPEPAHSLADAASD